jgi:hypothetical protein
MPVVIIFDCCKETTDCCGKTTVLKIVVDMFTDPVILESRD